MYLISLPLHRRFRLSVFAWLDSDTDFARPIVPAWINCNPKLDMHYNVWELLIYSQTSPWVPTIFFFNRESRQNVHTWKWTFSTYIWMNYLAWSLIILAPSYKLRNVLGQLTPLWCHWTIGRTTSSLLWPGYWLIYLIIKRRCNSNVCCNRVNNW